MKDNEKTLQSHSISFSTFDLPVTKDSNNVSTVAIESSTNPNLNYDLMVQQANEEQLIIINQIICVMQQNNTNKSNAYFICGIGGTGKTFLYQI